MSTLQEASDIARKFDFEKALLIVVGDNEAFMIDLNTDEQLFKRGIDSAGRTLGEYASADYAELKRILNPNSVVDLKLEGDFHESFFVDNQRFPILIDARDNKTDSLVDKYGEDIFGLTPRSISLFNQQILTDVQNTLKRGIGIL